MEYSQYCELYSFIYSESHFRNFELKILKTTVVSKFL